MGLTAALGIASNALEVFSTGIQVAGQNISNANTPGYIREQLLITPAPSYGTNPLILGSGVSALGVTQSVNQFLQTQVYNANSNYSASDARNTTYTQLQDQLQALGSSDLASQITSFVGAINDSANQPESAGLNQQVVDQGTQLANYISNMRSTLDQQRLDANVNVEQLVTQANSLIQQIADLNPQITKLESSGLLQSQAGSLRDQRYQALDQLSQILPISYREDSSGSINVYTGSDYLVLGTNTQQLQTVTSSDRGVGIENVQLSVDHATITADSSGSGQLLGVLQGRDTILGGFVDNLDKLTSNLIGAFNNIYSSGQGTDAFSSTTSDNSVSDPTAALNQAGLAYTPQSGSFQILLKNTETGVTSASTINVNLDGTGSPTSLNDLASQINAIGNVSATVTADGHLQINADPNYQFQFASDSSNVLSSLGINTFFTGDNSGNIGVDSAVTNDPNLFAAAQGGGPSDGTNALALSQFSSAGLAGLNGMSVNSYYNSMISDVANKASAESAMSSGLQDFRDSLVSQQQQYSGVSLDEEAIQIMQFQQSYQAAAKLVTTIDQLFQSLLQI